MAALIVRVRDLINDPAGSSQVWTDDQIQDVMDEGREDVVNGELLAKPTFTGSTIQYLNYYSEIGGWEADYVIKQYLVTQVTPSSAELIAGHFVFATTTLPPLSITGKRFDVYRAAADLLERWAAKYTLAYAFASDGQSFQRQQVSQNLCNLAKTYRQKQRPGSLTMIRSDLAGKSGSVSLSPTELDRMASG